MEKIVKFLLLYFGIVPLVFSFFAFAIMTEFDNTLLAALPGLIVAGCLTGFLVSKKHLKQENLKDYLVLILVPLAYTAALWALFMLISKGFYGADAWLGYSIFHLVYAPNYFIAMLMGEGRLFLGAPLAYELSFILGAALAVLKVRKLPTFKKKRLLSVIMIFMLGIGTGAAVQWHRSKTVLPSYGFEYGGGYSSTDLYPYDVNNPDNILPKLKTASTFTIKNPSEMPILDGAEAAFPVYSAFANAAYENIEKVYQEYGEVVTFTNTIYAYERLLTGDVDIYFGAEPSKEQQQMAKKAGKELVMTPIGKEAFVFFVNPDNKIDNLAVSEIKGIYSGKIKNWSKLGGKDEKIIAFQRPKNSGSQTLLEKIMGNTPIMKPLKEDVPEGMGGIIEQVADYRNYDNSIGFSFRFFATGMKANTDIKLLAINGIEPSPENIASGKYPFTASLYAITVKDNKKMLSIQPFLEWMQGPQSQEIVEEIGYIQITKD
ncbi:PstS family phosphate ABC transporter substrate-binding protein [Bacillus sp. UNC41MFS5]|uniref:PstS family phosphate ABC transporter substrate-binding protein n=1 Tax=Bacillus sp. UNC41MFS5 TaxID=1449046 RepID=UPI0005513565|nr:substrate-binding domain-containing protein [Bacillus sp. UNC41MFS5]